MSHAVAIKRGGGISPLWIILMITTVLLGSLVIYNTFNRAANMCEVPNCPNPATARIKDDVGVVHLFCDEHSAVMVDKGWTFEGPAVK